MYLSIYSNDDYWIGLWIETDMICDECKLVPESSQCEECRAKWTWRDAQPMNVELANNIWFNNEPTGEDNCGRMRGDGKWLDRFCVTGYEYICKRG